MSQALDPGLDPLGVQPGSGGCEQSRGGRLCEKARGQDRADKVTSGFSTLSEDHSHYLPAPEPQEFLSLPASPVPASPDHGWPFRLLCWLPPKPTRPAVGFFKPLEWAFIPSLPNTSVLSHKEKGVFCGFLQGYQRFAGGRIPTFPLMCSFP